MCLRACFTFICRCVDNDEMKENWYWYAQVPQDIFASLPQNPSCACSARHYLFIYFKNGMSVGNLPCATFLLCQKDKLYKGCLKLNLAIYHWSKKPMFLGTQVKNTCSKLGLSFVLSASFPPGLFWLLGSFLKFKSYFILEQFPTLPSVVLAFSIFCEKVLGPQFSSNSCVARNVCLSSYFARVWLLMVGIKQYFHFLKIICICAKRWYLKLKPCTRRQDLIESRELLFR